MKTCTTHHHACDCREERFAEMEKRLMRAEDILDRLAGRFWIHTLNDAMPGENIGNQIENYWRQINSEF